MTNKPIVHGCFDPTEVPYWCRRCIHYKSGKGLSFPICDKREDGKFKPEMANACLKLRPVQEELKE